MRILCDVDGVLANHTAQWLKCFEAITGRRYVEADVTTWNFRDCIPMTADEERETDALLALSLNFAEYQGAEEAVNRLLEEHDVVFVTSPSYHIPGWTEARQSWLAARFGPGARVVHTSHKEVVSGDLLIDDKPENLIRWLREHPRGCGILWARPYNQRADWASGGRIIRTDDWEDVRTIVSYISKQPRIASATPTPAPRIGEEDV